MKHALETSYNPKLLTIWFTNASSFLKFFSKTSFICSPSGGTNYPYYLAVFLYVSLLNFAMYARFVLVLTSFRYVPFSSVSEHSATQTPLSHYVRSSDWVETKCFRSKVAQRQTHSWLRLKSKLWCSFQQTTQKDWMWMLMCSACAVHPPNQAGDRGAAAIEYFWPGKERVRHRQCYSDPPHVVWDQETSVRSFIISPPLWWSSTCRAGLF